MIQEKVTELSSRLMPRKRYEESGIFSEIGILGKWDR